MKNVRSVSTLVTLVSFAVFVFVAIAWQPGNNQSAQKQNSRTTGQDTSVPKSTGIDQIDIQLNLDSAMSAVNEALSKIDYAKMNADMQKAMAQIDYAKINTDISNALKQIDWKTMKMNVSRSLDSAKMAIDKINWDKMKADMDKAQAEAKKAMAAQKINMDSIRIQVQKSLSDAQKSLQSAKIEFTNYKELKKALQQDGLIQEGKPYTIQLKEGILYINGAKQTKAITDKYSRYYPGKKNFTISDDGGVDL